MRLARFAKKYGIVFAESQLVKVILSKIDKHLVNLALPTIIMEFGGRATLVEAFDVVKQCGRALCQHNTTDLVSLLVDSSKSRRLQLQLENWRRHMQTTLIISGLVGKRTTLRKIVL